MKAYLRYFMYLFFICCSCALANPIDVINFRTSSSPAKLRLVFETTSKPEYLVFTLLNPYRLVLDIKNAHLQTTLVQKAFKHSLVKNFRMHRDKNNLRLVVGLKNPVQSRSFVIPPRPGHKYRLVIDLIPTKQPVIAALPPPNAKKVPLVAKKTVTTTPTPAVVSRPADSRLRNIIVVIDPGHGGKDPGTTGRGGMHEKDVVLAISKYLQQALNAEPGFKAVLTRTGNYYITLRGRLNIAREDKADMFVAIHADAYKNTDAMGASVFALSERGATSEAARWLAEKENSSELLGGASLPDNDNVLRSVLIDLSQTNTISESLQIGTSVLRQLDHVTVLHYPRVEQAAFVVLKSPDIPSLLVETGFLSTPRQEQQLRNPRYQQLLASAIKEGIKNYFVRNPPPGTWLAHGHINSH